MVELFNNNEKTDKKFHRQFINCIILLYKIHKISKQTGKNYLMIFKNINRFSK